MYRCIILKFQRIIFYCFFLIFFFAYIFIVLGMWRMLEDDNDAY